MKAQRNESFTVHPLYGAMNSACITIFCRYFSSFYGGTKQKEPHSYLDTILLADEIIHFE
jgi:hypothetical protein